MLISIAIKHFRLNETINKILKNWNNIDDINNKDNINKRILKEVVHKVKNILHFNNKVLYY